MGFIYKITCVESKKSYIGQTTSTVEKRWTSHKSAAKFNQRYLDGDVNAPHSKRGMCSLLYRAINKYGEDKFEVITLVATEDDKLDMHEMFFIADYKTLVPEGYNLKSGGDSSKHSEETKAILKIKNSEHMQKTFTMFRKHDEIVDLPQYCIYIETKYSKGVALNKHPLCDRKNFTVNKYGSIDTAKQKLLEFKQQLEINGIKYIKPIKKGQNVPRGIRTIKNGYLVEKTINKIKYTKAFTSADDQQNKNNAIEYLNNIINGMQFND